MPLTTFEIRKCDSCGLRYPLSYEKQHPGTRCPACMGMTRLILSRNLAPESKHHLPTTSSPKRKYAVLFDNIRSAWNVGSMLRSADGFGFDYAYMCGITPTPENEAVKKTSLGAENSVPWAYQKDAVILATELMSKGWKIIALEEHKNSIPLLEKTTDNSSNPALLIVGNETTGVDPHLLDLCNEIYHIPMNGNKKSFNVSIAFGVAAYALTKQ